MPPRSKTASSTPRLSEYARHFVYPTGIVRTVWPRVEAKGLELGLGFDWWQAQAGQVILGYGADGKYVATVGGVGLSIPRQVGKTYFVLAMLVVLCILFPGLQVVWTAHHLRTSTKTFTTLRGMCRRKKVAPHVRAMRAANGEQQVEFTNGSMIMFGARSMGFGRGFDEIDVEVFDEAQILDSKALEDMIAATMQARHPHGALLFFMGTPPRPTDPSTAFSTRRRRAIDGKSRNAVWLEIGADPSSDPDDRAQWPLMNPSFPRRTPVESMERLRENLGDDDSWNREGRGVWDDDSSEGIFPRWGDAFDASVVQPDRVPAIGLAGSMDGLYGSVGAACVLDDGRLAVAPVERRSGQRWLVGEAARIQREHSCAVVVDERGPLAYLLPALEAEGVAVTLVGTSDWCDACQSLWEACEGGRLVHPGDAALTAAARAAVWRTVGDRRAFGRKSGDISLLEAVALAAHATALVGAGFNVW